VGFVVWEVGIDFRAAERGQGTWQEQGSEVVYRCGVSRCGAADRYTNCSALMEIQFATKCERE
jgi:hypothetical protein